MEWFSKKDKGVNKSGMPIKENIPKKEEYGKLPELPNLPELPELPDIDESEEDISTRNIHQLPSFPTSPIGERFSRNTIKEAIGGQRRSEGVQNTDEFDSEEKRTMHGLLGKKLTRELPFFKPEITTRKVEGTSRMTRKDEPIFVRLDKFEESLNSFEKIKEQILEIEKTLVDIRKIKEGEEEELEFWENEIQKIKGKIDKIDNDIFSKIE